YWQETPCANVITFYQRRGSQNWYVRLQFDKSDRGKSLRTTDKREAEVLALPLIAEHKARLLESRPRIEPTWAHEYPPGREHSGPAGARIIATDRELIHIDKDGLITGRSPNGRPAYQIVNLERRMGIPGTGSMIEIETNE